MVFGIILGIIVVAWVTDELTRVKRIPASVTSHSEVLSIWLHPVLYKLAQVPADAATARSHEAYRLLAKQRGIEDAWYIITVRLTQTDGTSAVTPTIRWPSELPPPFFSEFGDVMATAAGSPPRYDPLYKNTDFSTAKVQIIPVRLLAEDPHKALDNLRMLEQHESAEKGR